MASSIQDKMTDQETASQKIAKGLAELFPNEVKIIPVKMLYEKEVRKYLMETEKAHKNAANSKLTFGEGTR